MKKRVIACMLALTMVFLVTACGNDNKKDTKETSKTEQQKDKDEKDLESEDVDEAEDTEEDTVTAERGTFDGNVYTNESMGFQATFPEGCTMYSDEEIQEVVGNGSDIMEEAYDSDTIENSLSGTIYDVIAVTADQTTNIQIVMEDTEVTAGRELTADEYAQAMTTNLKTAYKSAGIDVGEPEVTDATLGGMDFKVVSLSAGQMTQEYYAHKVGNYMLVFTMTYTDPTAVQEFLNSVTAL